MNPYIEQKIEEWQMQPESFKQVFRETLEDVWNEAIKTTNIINHIDA